MCSSDLGDESSLRGAGSKMGLAFCIDLVALDADQAKQQKRNVGRQGGADFVV